MRGIWTQASRPRLRGSHHISSVDSINSTLIRKTTTRPPRRRPSFCEHVFTVLITPVLAAALFVDTSWKAKQRRDWDEKLAAINDEIDQLKEREHRLVSSLRFRNVHHVLYQQQRGYATAAYAATEIDEDSISGEIEVPVWEDEMSLEHELSMDEKIPIREVLSPREFSPEQLSNFHRYHRLNAITLALKMLLHLRIGPNAFYSLASEDDPVDIAVLESINPSDETSLPTDSDRLVQMLALTRKNMRPLHNLKDLFHAAPYIQAQANRGVLHRVIQELTADFEAGKTSLPELVEGYGKAILQSDEVPCISVYVMLIRALSRIGSNSLAYHAAAALKNSTLPLSDPAIFYMLLQIGRACDSRSLANLLRCIANSDNPLNMINKWEKTRVDGMDLPVPTSLNPRLLVVLVYVALRCEQPDRAEAWLSLLREADYGSMWKHDVFRSFLAYYSHHGNWEQGKRWLQRSVHHALSIANLGIDRLARVIYRMLDLCVRCRKLPEYTAILDAAVESGIGPPLVDKSGNDFRALQPRTRGILLEWEALPLPENCEGFPVATKAKSFQYACRSLIQELSGKPQKSVKGQKADEDSELVLFPSGSFIPNQRYAVRTRSQLYDEASASTEYTAEGVKELQNKLTQQEALVAEMKARFDLTVLRQKSYEEEGATRAQKWVKSANKLGEEVQETLIRFQKLRKQYTEQEVMISELKTQLALAAVREQVQTERVQGSTDSVAQMAKEVRELREQFEKLQSVSSGPATTERADVQHTVGLSQPDGSRQVRLPQDQQDFHVGSWPAHSGARNIDASTIKEVLTAKTKQSKDKSSQAPTMPDLDCLSSRDINLPPVSKASALKMPTVNQSQQKPISTSSGSSQTAETFTIKKFRVHEPSRLSTPRMRAGSKSDSKDRGTALYQQEPISTTSPSSQASETFTSADYLEVPQVYLENSDMHCPRPSFVTKKQSAAPAASQYFRKLIPRPIDDSTNAAPLPLATDKERPNPSYRLQLSTQQHRMRPTEAEKTGFSSATVIKTTGVTDPPPAQKVEATSLSHYPDLRMG